LTYLLELGRNRLVLDRVALTNEKLVAKALCALRLRAVRKPVVVLTRSCVIPGAAVPAYVVAERSNGPHAVDEFKLADFVEEFAADVSV
jgi:hypothetical protein